METMNSNNSNNKNIDSEFIELSNFNYEQFQNMTIGQNKHNNSFNSIYSNSDKSSRSRGVSITEIDWAGLTKKFFFG
jgi:hypothetical protein